MVKELFGTDISSTTGCAIDGQGIQVQYQRNNCGEDAKRNRK